jgi:hypothetical protein
MILASHLQLEKLKSIDSLIVDIKTIVYSFISANFIDVAFEMRGSELDLINFYKFHMFLQSSVDESGEFWLNTVPKHRKSEYRPEKSE